jgi:hypothetical protein
MIVKYALLASTLALAPLIAQAQSTYRCVGNDGKKYYGSTIPPQCQGRLIEEISAQGTVLRRIDPEGDGKMRVAKEAEAVKKREEEAIAKDATRRNRALLATYTSEKDVEDARARALNDNEKAAKEVEQRIADIKKRQAIHQKEMEFYVEGAAKAGADKKGKPATPAAQAKDGPKPPPKLLEEMESADADLKAQESLLAAKKKDIDTINAKYDEDKKRYLELMGKDAGDRGRALGMDKGVTVTTKAGSRVDEIRNERDAQKRAREERQELENLERSRGRPVQRLERK